MFNKPMISHLLVALQFTSIILGILPYAGQLGSPWWLASSAIGIAVGLYTLLHNRVGNFGVYPEPLGHAELVTSGPYHWVRHPMYLSLLLFMLGIAMYNGAIFNQLSLIGLLIAVLGKMHMEENYLRSHFEDYAAYCCRNKRLLPFLY